MARGAIAAALVLGAIGGEPSCHLTDSSCSLEQLPRDVSTLIYPGGATRCIFSDSPEYGFQVIPGSSEKLLLFFQGGGACFNDVSSREADSAPCLSHLVLQPLFGIFNREKVSNPFRDYTIVHVNYCSGDLHVGNVLRWYLDRQLQRVEQRGYVNALAGVKWARKNVGQLSSLVVAGSSTGALGAQLWMETILQTFSYQAAALLMDSDMAILPSRTEGPLLKGFGACDTGLFESDAKQKCAAGELTIQAVLEQTMARHKEVTMAAISSLQDRMQVRFYNAVCMAEMLPADLTPYDFERKLMTRLEEYNRYPNFVTYLVPGDRNYFLPLEAFFGEAALPQWLSTLPELAGQQISSFCSGKCGTLSSKSFMLTSHPVNQKGELPKESAPSGEAKLIQVPELSRLPWWSSWYHVALLSVALALCIGAFLDRRSPSSYSASRSFSEDDFSDEDKI